MTLDRNEQIEDAYIHGTDTLVWTGPASGNTPGSPLNIVAPPSRCFSYEIMLETLQAHRANYRLVVQAGTMNGAVNGAAVGLGYLALPRSVVPPALAEVRHEAALPQIKKPFFWGVHVNRGTGRGAWSSAAERFGNFLALGMGHREPLAASGGRR